MSADLNRIREQLRQYAESGGRVEREELDSLSAMVGTDVPVEVDGETRQVSWAKLLQSLQGAIPSGEQPEPGSAAQLTSLFEQIAGGSEELKNLQEALKALQGGTTEEKLNERAELMAKRELLMGRMTGMFAAAETIVTSHPDYPNADKLDDLKAQFQALSEGAGEDSSMQMSTTPRAQTTGRDQTQGGGAGAAKAQTVQFPALKAQVGGAQFSSDAYQQSLSLDNFVLSVYDTIQENSKRGKELVMLFAYYAQRAMSGDMGAMYQFQKFLTYIISKDKAKQQIDLGKKLVQLQDDSRRATNKLLNAKFDPNDPNASFEQSKLLTSVKSETDAIATSQKLIAQSMEEFGVVVETLTGLEKSSLETWKRVMQKLSA